ncbi:MAG: YscO family type III secretion system apparatus protein [Planctomycetota bacterium]
MPEKYPLRDLEKVRRIREENAASEVLKAKNGVLTAQEEVLRCEKEVESYHDWRLNREEELYQEIVDQQIQLKELDGLKIQIQLLRDKELMLHRKVEEAKKKLEDAKQHLLDAQDSHRQASRDLEKIEKHKEEWAQEAAKEAESNLEKEMEDFRVRSPDW